jgi:hypothetical protein
MGVAIPILFALGGILITVDQFTLAEACFGISGLWFMGWVIILPYYNTPFDSRKEASLWGLMLLPILVVCGLIVVVEQYKSGRYDVLEPANEVAEDRHCKAPNENSVAIYLGPHTFYIGNFPQQIITIANRDILTLDKKDNDIVITTLRLYDDSDNIFARIDENGFWVSPDVRKKRPDRSSLIVYDKHDDEALNIRYVNPRVISINGLFQYQHRTALFKPTFFKMGGISGAGICTTNEVSFNKSVFVYK